METPNQCEDTATFLLVCRNRLQHILRRLDWTEEGVVKNFNTNSKAAPAVLEQESKNQEPVKRKHDYPPTCWTKNSWVLPTPELQWLLQDDKVEAPANFLDLQANFSREQKLCIYEHVIQNTQPLNNNVIDEVPEGVQTLADILAENKREAKRKKRKFRKSKPTRIEEVRALVDLQMQSLQQFIKSQGGKVEGNKVNPQHKDYSKSHLDRKQDKFWAKHPDHNRDMPSRKSNTSIRKDYRSKEHDRPKEDSSSFSYRRNDREWDRSKRHRSRSPESRKCIKITKSDLEGKEAIYPSRRRSKSLEPERNKKYPKAEKKENHLKTNEHHKRRENRSRSRSREKRYHSKKRHKKSRSRSKDRKSSKRSKDRKADKHRSNR